MKEEEDEKDLDRRILIETLWHKVFWLILPRKLGSADRSY